MGRELGGLQRGGDDQADRRRLDRAQFSTRHGLLGAREDRCEATGVELLVQRYGGGDKEEVADARGDVLLAGRDDRPGTVTVEPQQLVQRQADGHPDPGQHQQYPVPRQHQNLDQGDRDGQATEEDPMALVAVEAGATEPEDHHREQSKNGKHDRAERIDEHRQAETAPARRGALHEPVPADECPGGAGDDHPEPGGDHAQLLHQFRLAPGLGHRRQSHHREGQRAPEHQERAWRAHGRTSRARSPGSLLDGWAVAVLTFQCSFVA